MELLNWARAQWDRVAAWVAVALGALAVILGWVGVTGTPYTFEQIPYIISGGLGGLFLLGVGAMLWISADMRDEWRKLDELVRLQDAAVLQPSPPAGVQDDQEVAPATTPGSNGKRVARVRPKASAEGK